MRTTPLPLAGHLPYFAGATREQVFDCPYAIGEMSTRVDKGVVSERASHRANGGYRHTHQHIGRCHFWRQARFAVRRTFRHRPREHFPVFVALTAQTHFGDVLADHLTDRLRIKFFVTAAAQNLRRFDHAFKKRTPQNDGPKTVVAGRFNQQDVPLG
jgi:hypothetical protein